MNHIQKDINTDRLLLRNIISTDIEYIYKGLSHPQVIAHYGVSFDSLKATEEQMDWFEKASQCWWAICSRDNDSFYGAGGLNDISDIHKKAEIGLWLLPQYWGQGFMPEALPLICQYGFKELGLHRIEGFVESNNTNCKRAMSKMDFKLEGTMRDCELKDGQFISVDIYAKLNR